MMSSFISAVLLLCYCSLTEGNIAVTLDNGTIVCKLKKQMPVVEFWNEHENETLASCYESSCYVHTGYFGQFTISCDVLTQQTFYLKIENMSIYLEKKFYCKDGVNSGFVIFDNTETKVDELEESQKHDRTAVAVIAVIVVLAVVAVIAACMFCGRGKKRICVGEQKENICVESQSKIDSNSVCNKRVSGTPKELKEPVELCLKRRDGELDAVDVKAEEQFQEYTWAGQTRKRASSMLDGGYAVCNKRVSGTPEELKEHVGAYNPEDSVTSSRENCEPNDDIVSGEETGGSAGQIITTLRCPLKEKNEQTGPKCFICVEQYNKPMGSTQCAHVHCEECWLRTMRAKKLCPQCNKITSPADLHRIYLSKTEKILFFQYLSNFVHT